MKQKTELKIGGKICSNNVQLCIDYEKKDIFNEITS